MKDLGKILLLNLPPALEMALLQQFKRDSTLSAAAGAKPPATPFDLVIHTGEIENLPGTLRMKLNPGKPQRLGLLLRQARQMLDEPVLYLDEFRIGPYLFQPQEKALVQDGGDAIALTDREADILVYLARRRDLAVSRDELLRHVWRYQEGIDTHTLETHIYRLRQKIEASADRPALLVTEEGGYRLNL